MQQWTLFQHTVDPKELCWTVLQWKVAKKMAARSP